MKFTKDIVNDLADKLLIGLSEEENTMILNEFEEIDRNMNLINEIADIEDLEPLVHPFELEDIELRVDDEEILELSVEEVLQNAGVKTDKVVIVPKVVGE